MNIVKFLTEDVSPKHLKQCQQIAFENHVVNGGTLNFDCLITASDTNLLIIENDNAIGYMAIRTGNQHLYEMQVAIAKSHQGKDLGHALLDATEQLALDLNKTYLIAHITKTNRASQKLHHSHGFEFNDYQGAYMLDVVKKHQPEREL